MNIIVPWIDYGKLYLWKLFHSLINYFFNLHIKKAYNINKNCYIFVKRLGRRNEILINYLNCGSNKCYSKLEFRFVKFIMSFNRQIPIINIQTIEFNPTLLTSNKYEDTFKIWKNCYYNTLRRIEILNLLKDELKKYIIFRIQNINLHLKSYSFLINYFRLIKNDNKTRISIAKCKIRFKTHFIGSVKNLKISHDKNTDIINVYGDKLVLIVSHNFIKFPILDEIQQIMKMFDNDNEGKLPNIFFKEIIIQFTINNHLRLVLNECFFEDYILKCNVLIKIWQKEIFWFKKCNYNTKTNELDIDNVRIRLFKSTADKIFKTFRPLYKNFYRPKSRSKSMSNCKIESDQGKLSNTARIDLNYLESLTNTTETNIDSNDLLKSYHPILNNNYLDNCDDFIVNKLFNIKKLTIDFQNNNGSFIFKNFNFSQGEAGFRVSCSRWTFIKNNITFLDGVNDNSKFTIEYRDNSLLLFPYHLYINFSVDDFASTFSEFTNSIGKIVNIFSTGNCCKNNYIYDKFYIDSSRLLFSYKSKKIKMLKLLAGKYIELLNVLNIKDLDFILREVTINYPENFNYIISHLISHILDDILENNFDTLIKNTPMSSTYKLKQIIENIPSLTGKVYRILK